jgi:hypothetical protein
MATIDKNTLILTSVSHILMQLRRICERVDEIEVNTSDILHKIAAKELEDDEEDEDEVCDAEALADQLLDAADEIEDSGMVPNAESAAAALREIAEELRE